MLIHVTKLIRSDVIDSLCSEKNLVATGHSWLKSNDPALLESSCKENFFCTSLKRQSTKMTILFVLAFTQNLKELKTLTRRTKLRTGSRSVVGIYLKGDFNNSCEILFSLKNVLRKAQGTLILNINLTNCTSNRGVFQLIFSLHPGHIKRFQEKGDQSVETAYPTTSSQWQSLVPWLASKWRWNYNFSWFHQAKIPTCLPGKRFLRSLTAVPGCLFMEGRRPHPSQAMSFHTN